MVGQPFSRAARHRRSPATMTQRSLTVGCLRSKSAGAVRARPSCSQGLRSQSRQSGAVLDLHADQCNRLALQTYGGNVFPGKPNCSMPPRSALPLFQEWAKHAYCAYSSRRPWSAVVISTTARGHPMPLTMAAARIVHCRCRCPPETSSAIRPFRAACPNAALSGTGSNTIPFSPMADTR